MKQLSENNFFKIFKYSQLQTKFHKNKNRNNIKKLYTSFLDKNSFFFFIKRNKIFFSTRIK